MTDRQLFHIYKKNTKTTEVVAHSLTVDELEQMIAEKKVDWLHWEIQPCYTEYQQGDASF